MNGQLAALRAELLKNRYSTIVGVTFIAFALAPLMGGVFMMIVQDAEAMARTGALQAKARMMNFSADWNSYFGLLSQAIGVGGVLVFGFVASWLFGREYTEGTAKDLLALPTSRTSILNAKFILYFVWCLALAVSNLLLGLLIGLLLGISGADSSVIYPHLTTYFFTTLLTVLLGTPIAFFAIWGKGYLAPLGFVALTLVFAQVVAAAGYGFYFPWSIPGLYSVMGGGFQAQLTTLSYATVGLLSVAGYLGTLAYWNYADQSK